MGKHHSVIEVAGLSLVGLAGLVGLMIGLSNRELVVVVLAAALLGLTALIWRGGPGGSLAMVVGLLGVAGLSGGFGVVAYLALVTLFVWGGEQLTRVLRARESREQSPRQ